MSLTVYKSSAGSGKTHTLVKEYLILVIKEPFNYGEILAVTFTNKAAAEMKNRILFYLIQLSSYSNSDLINQLIFEIKVKTGLNDDIIKQRAEKVLGLLLHNYSDFAIGTIDSFAHKIVRTFSYDLFLPVNFEVEMDFENLLSQSIDLLINNIGFDDALTKVIVEYSESKTDDEENWNIEKELFKFSSTLFKEDSIKYIDKLEYHSIKDFIVIRNNINKSIKDFENKIYEEALIAYNLIKANNISQNAFYYKGVGAGKYFENLSKKQYNKIEPNIRVQSTFEEDNWFSKEATESEKAALKIIKPQLQNAFINIRNFKEFHYKRYMLYSLIFDNIYGLTLLHEVKKTLDELKKQNNIVIISDFNKKIADIILNEPVPYIYERIGERYKNYFIDEFQDTSIGQWQNMLPLIDNSLSEGGYNLIVGDAKQAIYRFRSGEVEQFANLPNIYGIERTKLIEERESTLKRNYKEENLQNNFRSKAEIVDFNNSFFEKIKELLPESVQSIYNNHEQNPKEKNTGGLVSIDFLPKSDEISKTYDDITNNKILAIIHDLTEDNFHHSDIAILCRSNKNASNIARFLIKNGINVVSSESLLLKSSPDVLFIISCLRYLNNSDDIIPVFAIINYLKCNSRYEIGEEPDKLIPLTSDKYKIFEIFKQLLKQNNIQFNHNYLIKFMIYELCEELIRIFKLNNRKHPYLIAFLDNVFKYSNKKTNNLTDFLEWWDKENEKLSIITPEGINAVQISTIHKAKGLEFPAVIYPYAKGSTKNTKSTAWLDLENEKIDNLPTALVSNKKDLINTDYGCLFNEEVAKTFLDVINLLYVVFTRPSERLYVLSEFNKIRKSDEDNKTNDISKMLTFYLNKMGRYDESKSGYIFGIKTKHLSAEKKSKTEVQYSDSIISENLKDKVFIKSVFDQTSLSIQFEENILWGNIFHSILSKIYTPDDIEKAVDDFFANELYPDKYKNIIRKKIEKLLSNELVKPYFIKGLKVFNESELVCEDGKLLRPDRIIFNERSVVVIDYKTGKLKESHKNQINEYVRTLEAMNYKIDKKLLINISSEIVEEML